MKLKDIFTKEVLISSAMTFVIVVGAITFNEMVLKPKLMAMKNENETAPSESVVIDETV